MKYFFAYIIIVLLSCGVTIYHKPNIPLFSTEDISGQWVNVKYLRSVLTTKSAKISQVACELSYVEINNDTALIIINFHESLTVHLENTYASTFVFKSGDYIYNFVAKNDTLFSSYQNTYDSLPTYDTLIKYNMTFTDPYKKSNKLLNQEIFTGNHQIVDSSNKTLTFYEEGEVKGFKKFKYYSVLEDYFDAGCNFDILFLYNDNTACIEYTWKHFGDTLAIYELDCLVYDSTNNYCYDNKVGKLVYKLFKE